MDKDKKVKNKIIALSGQPVTGKGTAVKGIIEKLKIGGYKEENIHVISTGEEFRNYFNSISEFIRNFENPNKLKELSNNEYLKAISENREYRDILINTIKTLKENNIDNKSISIEEANNLKEFNNLRKIVDTLIDTGIEAEGKRINKEARPNDIWIIDSRLAFNNIPEAFSVRLVTTPEIAGKRLFNDKNRGEEDSNYKNVEEAIEAREKRRIGEQERYKKRYGVDLEDEDNYDLIIDTSYSQVQDVSDTILTCMDRYIEDKFFTKNWTSPKTLLPLQRERDTLAHGMMYTFEELIETIKEEGYDPSSDIEVVEVDGIKYIIEGHHRNFCSAYIGKTLVPYTIIAKDDESIPGFKDSARTRVEGLSENHLLGHEQFFEHNTDSRFSYEDVYPGIYRKIKEKQGIEH